MTIPAVVPRRYLERSVGDQPVALLSEPPTTPDRSADPLTVKGRLDYTEPGKIPELLHELYLYRPAARFSAPLQVTDPAP